MLTEKPAREREVRCSNQKWQGSMEAVPTNKRSWNGLPVRSTYGDNFAQRYSRIAEEITSCDGESWLAYGVSYGLFFVALYRSSSYPNFILLRWPLEICR